MIDLKRKLFDYPHTLGHIQVDKPAAYIHQFQWMKHDYIHQETDLFHFLVKGEALIC